MKDFSMIYQDAVNQIIVPEFRMKDINNTKKIYKIIRKRQIAAFLSAAIVILLVSILAGGTAYAMLLQRDIFRTERGYKIDDSNPDDAEDGTIIRYTIGEDIDAQYELPEKIADSVTDELIVYDVSTANLYMPFEIIEADVNGMDLKEIYIHTPEITNINSYESVLEYSNAVSHMNVTYRFFVRQNWAYETDFGDNYVDTMEYINAYNTKFTIIEGYYEPMNKVIYEASAAFKNMLITIDTESVDYDELIAILDSLDLNAYR